MSEIALLNIKDGNAFLAIGHYRDIVKLLNKGKICKPFWLDAGYIVVDWDRATIASCQSCFKPADLTNNSLKRFSWIDL